MTSIDLPQTPDDPSEALPKSSMAIAEAGVEADSPPAEPIYGNIIPNRIFVGGISRDTSEYDLMVVFSAYGKVRNTKIIVNHDGFNKGYGFVTFETEEEVQRLQSVCKYIILHNRRLNIAPAFKKQPVRRMLQQIVDPNGTIYSYFTTNHSTSTQPSSPIGNSVNLPIDQYTTSSYPAEFTAAAVPTIYQQAPPGAQFQPIYQYYSVPVSVPNVWHQNYYPDPQQTSWEFDNVNNNNNWGSS
ncbi:protein boule-like [Drosophila innubila]|uniref:protein boule-like n=1 Tax=Drosophila innubila TaxID=198719 RepID=UPI00148D1655|nr:protein boule-like [Drosophila innubila]XP_034471758.1 protein boule-like [Drosophila innubila]